MSFLYIKNFVQDVKNLRNNIFKEPFEACSMIKTQNYGVCIRESNVGEKYHSHWDIYRDTSYKYRTIENVGWLNKFISDMKEKLEGVIKKRNNLRCPGCRNIIEYGYSGYSSHICLESNWINATGWWKWQYDNEAESVNTCHTRISVEIMINPQEIVRHNRAASAIIIVVIGGDMIIDNPYSDNPYSILEVNSLCIIDANENRQIRKYNTDNKRIAIIIRFFKTT